MPAACGWCVGLAALLYAVRSSWAVASAGAAGAVFALGELGDLLTLPGWVTGLSPYAHARPMPVEAFAAAPALVLTALAAGCLAAAWWRYARRDIG